MFRVCNRRQALLGLAVIGWGGAAAARPAARPDLTGVWTNGSFTMLERPKEFTTLVVGEAEAEAWEAPRRALKGVLPTEFPLGQAEAEYPETGPGLARIRGQIRTSWITDPPDGKLPWTPEARIRYAIGKPPVERFDNIEERPTAERCLTPFGSFAPIMNSPDTNYVQIVQTPRCVAIVAEKNHDARIVKLDAAPTPPDAPPVWMGHSVGRWEGATLVVENSRMRFTRVRGLILTESARVVERFTRSGPDEITYLFEVTDPALFTRGWSGEMLFRRADDPLYEFACHEGNYSLPSMLSAARQGNQGPAVAPAR